jgi:geranylgeranyl diphosphate synthase type II
MEIPVIRLPRPVPPERLRAPQENIPPTRPQREELRRLAARYLEEVRPVPPLALAELRSHCEELGRRQGVDPRYRDYLAVILNSELWREQLARVPYHRRLLLLPKCLRVEDRCPAPFDDFGLLCKQCGLCSIQDLQEEAERLGYAVLVAEGSAIVMALIQTGKVEAIVGVSCLSVLERAFPYLESAAIPGVAIPLLQDDCKDTTIDLEWVWEVIHLTSDDKTRRLDLDALRQEVTSWFEPRALDGLLGPGEASATERIARGWLGRAGKRWRPFLTACAFRALKDDPQGVLPEELKKAALAVECFHKASLIHDDIEDQDPVRYGERALHEEFGVPVALNTGDLLVGEGYRLLAGLDGSPDLRARLSGIAAAGHRTLCLGQGAELYWMRDPQPLSPLQVLEIFRRKTAPAFQVALELGAAMAGAEEEVFPVLTRYSEALGIAYQIRDDLEDLGGESGCDTAALRPTLPLALALERAKGADRQLLEEAWRRAPGASSRPEAIRRIIAELGVEARCRSLLESYKEEAVRSLKDLKSSSLKGLLRRVLGKIFSVEIKGWCSEFEARNAPGGAPGAAGAR